MSQAPVVNEDGLPNEVDADGYRQGDQGNVDRFDWFTPVTSQGRAAEWAAVALPEPARSDPGLEIYAGGVRRLGALATIPGRTTTDPTVLREHAAAVLAVARKIEALR